MIRRGSRWSGTDPAGVWRHGTQLERAVAVCALALVGVLVLLTVLVRGVWPLPVAGLLVYGQVLWWLRSRIRRRGRRERLLAEEAARGVSELERWLANGPRA